MRSPRGWLVLVGVLALAGPSGCDGGGGGSSAPAGDGGGGGSSAPAGDGQARGSPNVLLVIADDVGVDRLASYGLGSEPAYTPTLDALAAEGVQFERAWSAPSCSPTRAWLLTGRYGFRTGIGVALVPEGDSPLIPYDTWTLPKLLATAPARPYASAALGKWHLAPQSVAGPDPLGHGFGRHVGPLANLTDQAATDGLPQDFFYWQKSIDGVLTRTTRYATQDTTDEAIAAIAGMSEPWLAWVAYNAAHMPWHEPPRELWTGPEPVTDADLYEVMIEALDSEIGRLLGSIDPAVLERTLVIVLGDNGTPRPMAFPPLDPVRVKGSTYEGGVRVPLLMVGAGVEARGARVAAPVSLVDIYATLAELAGIDPAHPAVRAATDSVSLVPYLSDPARPPLRATVYTERFVPNGPGPYNDYTRAIRDERYKLIQHADGTESLYDLGDDWLEDADLLEGALTPAQQLAWERLGAELDAMEGS